ncbi:MAG TPA: hypothetical protein VFX95_05395 [Caulobacteraceae bacterium]|nr:hypothetical protein [Caulobacteraceae bacterium]
MTVLRGIPGMALRPVANPRDLPAFAGVLLALTALAMPWSRRRACPIFEECGPWETVSGWEAFGAAALIGLALAMLAAVAIRDPVLRRVVPALVCAALGAALVAYKAMSFEVFAEEQGPLPGFFAFVAGLGLAVVGWFLSALAPPRPAPPVA